MKWKVGLYGCGVLRGYVSIYCIGYMEEGKMESTVFYDERVYGGPRGRGCTGQAHTFQRVPVLIRRDMSGDL